MHIWLLPLPAERETPHCFPAAYQLLPTVDCIRASRLPRSADRNRFTLAHALCRAMLAHFGNRPAPDWILTAGPKGRPQIAPEQTPQNLDFNLSHTQNLVGCALGIGERVGLDLERTDRAINMAKVAARKFAESERDQLAAVEGTARRTQFFALWTLKEAHAKLTGSGLTKMRETAFDLSGDHPKCRLRHQSNPDDQHPPHRQLGLFRPTPDHQAAWALATANPTRSTPQIRTWTLAEFARHLQAT
ncbi:MAG: 4'-phosphopantetheinyl transferase superfamily protein [Cellvibrionales bacterium]|nr:4'-phosphopantetheinyl transferase superfamily protein [Cellvibrionales bacterium]